MTMVEKMADAMAFRDAAGEPTWEELAIAALKAMREPTEAMVNPLIALSVDDAERVWQAMIDQAIAEAETK